MRIGIECPNKTRPIPLHDRYDRCVGGEVAGGCSTVRVVHTPNCVQFDRVGDAEAGGLLVGVDHVVALISSGKAIKHWLAIKHEWQTRSTH